MKPSKPAKADPTKQKLLSLVRLDPPQTREELIRLCHETTRLTIERDAAQLALDEQIAALKETHAPEIEALAGQIERNVGRLHAWAEVNRDQEFGGKQGIQVAGCTLEFRKGSGRVESEKSDAVSLNQILALPDKYAEEQGQLVRIKCELNKAAVQAMAKTAEGTAFLKLLGLRIVVDEEFKFTPAREDLTEIPVVSTAAQAA